MHRNVQQNTCHGRVHQIWVYAYIFYIFVLYNKESTFTNFPPIIKTYKPFAIRGKYFQSKTIVFQLSLLSGKKKILEFNLCALILRQGLMLPRLASDLLCGEDYLWLITLLFLASTGTTDLHYACLVGAVLKIEPRTSCLLDRPPRT